MKMNKIRNRLFYSAAANLAVNLLYALYNGILGCITYSWWLITVAAYYVILSIMRFSAVLCKARNKEKETEYFVMRFSGFMFLALSVVLIGTIYMTVKFDVGVKYHEIVMITIATYAFTKITLAIVKFIKAKKDDSPLITTIRSISFADAAVSIFSLQRSMLVSFGEMNANNILILNTSTGIGVCLIVIILGVNMIIRKDLKNGKIKNS